MTEDVSTRLQKDMKKVDMRIDEQLDKLEECLRNNLFTDIKNALEHLNAEVSSIKQYVFKSNTTSLGKQT